MLSAETSHHLSALALQYLQCLITFELNQAKWGIHATPLSATLILIGREYGRSH